MWDVWQVVGPRGYVLGTVQPQLSPQSTATECGTLEATQGIIESRVFRSCRQDPSNQCINQK